MLNLEQFTCRDGRLSYEGETHHYYISHCNCYYSLAILTLNGDFNRYYCGSLTTAIASIEAVERGEEI